MKYKYKTALAATALTVAMAAGSAHAATYGFLNITGNSAANAATGEAQFSMDVTDSGNGNVLFQFFNIGPEDSVITQLYWEDGNPDVLSSVVNVINGSGTSFALDSRPNNLPGGNTIAFLEAFDVDADNPAPHNGINPGETLSVEFDLFSGFDFDDVLAQLDAGSLRVGFHAQAFENGGSESFVTCSETNPCGPTTDLSSVPVPASLPLLLTALGGVGILRRRARKSA